MDDFSATADVTAAGAAERFTERAGVDVDAVLHSAELRGAASAGTDEADGVTVVDHHHGPIAFGEITNFGQRRNETIHRKDPVGHDEFVSSVRGVGSLKLGFEISEVAVPVAVALRFAKPNAVDDGRVVEGVADDGVLGRK